LAISVPAKPRRRTASTSTCQSRSWLARIVAALVRSA
jgi:hypothetical protein